MHYNLRKLYCRNSSRVKEWYFEQQWPLNAAQSLMTLKSSLKAAK